MKLSLRQNEVSNYVSKTTNLLKDLCDIVSQYVYHESFKMKPTLTINFSGFCPISLHSRLSHQNRCFKWNRTGPSTGRLSEMGVDHNNPKPITTTPPCPPNYRDQLGFFSGETEDEIWLFQEGCAIVFSAQNLFLLRTVTSPFLLDQQFYSTEGENVLMVEYEGKVTIFE